MNLALSNIIGVLQGTASTVADGVVPAGYSIDSRTIQARECFIAIRGPRFDGHEFIPEAVRKGACLVIAQKGCFEPSPLGVPCILVDDTLSALQRLANHVRRQWGRPVVAITGSTGKTTTKEIASFLLSGNYRVFKSVGNFNNDYGLPLSLLKLTEWDKMAVLELGMSAAGEIARLARIAEPNVAVVTNVKPVHLEFFDSIEGIARAKRELIDSLPADGVAILNNDDTRVRKFARHFSGKIITYGVRSAAAYRVTGIVFKGLDGCQFQLEHKNATYRFDCPLIGEHNVYNCLPGLVVAHQFGMDFKQLAERLRQLQTPAGRGEVLRLGKGLTVINDSYNSNPAALEAMIQLLKKVQGFKRKILVAGEMLELGEGSPDFHYRSGKLAAQSGLDYIVGVRGNAQHLVNAARLHGYDESHAVFFEEVNRAAQWLEQQLQAGDLILVKGSRGVKTERVIERLQWRHV